MLELFWAHHMLVTAGDQHGLCYLQESQPIPFRGAEVGIYIVHVCQVHHHDAQLFSGQPWQGPRLSTVHLDDLTSFIDIWTAQMSQVMGHRVTDGAAWFFT